MKNDKSIDLGFTYVEKKNGDVVIEHHGKKATILRGNKSITFKEQLKAKEFADQQQLMARLTGNYKKGNERQARKHQKNV